MKGIKIFGVLAAASLLFSVNAFAQENANRDENGKVVRGPYETNKAFDNTFIAIGAGVNSTVPSIKEPKNWGGIGVAIDVNVGKWFTPAIGARLGWQGLQNNTKLGLTNQGIKAGDSYGFNYFHGDFMWNMTNTCVGYRETRVYNFIPYATMGVLNVSKRTNILAGEAKNNWQYAAGFGIYNTFRCSNRVSIYINLQGLIGRASQVTNNAGKFILYPSATAGLVFNLWKTNFDRHSSITPVVIPVPFTTEQYNALADKVAALEKENAALKDKIASLEKELAPVKNLVNGQTYLYQNGTFTAVDVTPGAPLTVYFNCGSATISAREKAHIEYFANNVVKADTKIAIDGYADKQTGSAKRNQQLSEQRAKAVADLLKKAGATESNITTNGHGATVQLFDGAAKNRVVTVTVK